jgi:hypothetical protein
MMILDAVRTQSLMSVAWRRTLAATVFMLGLAGPLGAQEQQTPGA